MAESSKFGSAKVKKGSSEHEKLVGEARVEKKNEEALTETIRDGKWRPRSAAEKIVNLPGLKDFISSMDFVDGFGFDPEGDEVGEIGTKLQQKSTVETRNKLVEVLQGKTRYNPDVTGDGGVSKGMFYRDLTEEELAEKKEEVLKSLKEPAKTKSNINMILTLLVGAVAVGTGLATLPVAAAITAGGIGASKMYEKSKMDNVKKGLDAAQERHSRRLQSHGAPDLPKPHKTAQNTVRHKKEGMKV